MAVSSIVYPQRFSSKPELRAAEVNERLRGGMMAVQATAASLFTGFPDVTAVVGQAAQSSMEDRSALTDCTENVPHPADLGSGVNRDGDESLGAVAGAGLAPRTQ
jgi:hypothetical protein